LMSAAVTSNRALPVSMAMKRGVRNLLTSVSVREMK
jgi:hypothetical protein